MTADRSLLGLGSFLAFVLAVTDRRYRFAILRLDHLDDGQLKLGGEFEVALVVGGHGHDCTRAVAHHDIVGDPHGDLLAVDGVDGMSARGHAGLVFVQVAAVEVGLAGAGLLVVFDGGLLISGGDLIDERMLGGEHHVGGAEQGIRTSRENGDGRIISAFGGHRLRRPFAWDDFKRNLRALRATNPVLLQELDAFGPVEAVELVD